MRVICPACGAAIPGADIDLTKGIALCRPCGEIVPIASAKEEKLYKPANVRFTERVRGDVYVAEMPPNRAATAPALLFLCFWDGFLVLWYWNVFSKGLWGMGLFTVLHLAAGVYLTHKTLIELFNVRTLRIGGGRVVFRSAPIPFGGRLDLPIDALDSFRVVDTPTRSSMTHHVVANLANGTSRKLDVVTTEFDGTRYIAESFNDALKRARKTESVPELPAYRS